MRLGWSGLGSSLKGMLSSAVLSVSGWAIDGVNAG